MRQHPEEKPEGAPEWMVSYADMITILMSFFVVMFSIASGEAAKGKRTPATAAGDRIAAVPLRPQVEAVHELEPDAGQFDLPGGGKGRGSPAPLPAVGDPGGTVRVLKMEKARIRVPGHGDLIAIGGMVYFNKATTDLAPGQDGSIQKIAEELAGKPQQVEIVATASNQPLPPGCLFRDRWELSYARCRQAAELFTSLKIEPERLRLSVLPATAEENKGSSFSEADVAVRVFLSTTLPAGVK